MNFVIGASTTSGLQQQSGGATAPAYQGTAPAPVPNGTGAQLDEQSQRLVRWQESEEARPYAGRWVLLDAKTLDVLDTDTSASELLSRKAPESSAVIVYVQDAAHLVV